MDPISKEIDRLRETLWNFRQNPKARILHVITQPSQVRDITKALRAEEWQPENRCPFLIFDTAFITKESAFEEMCAHLREHYDLLRKGLTGQNIELPEFDVPLKGKESPDFIFALHVQEFHRRIHEHFDGLMVCWLPTRIDDKREWEKTVTRLLSLPFEKAIRFVIADEGNKTLEKEFKDIDQAVITTTFFVDEKSVRDYFKKLMSSDGKSPPPSIPGVMPGAARPDVPPPPRLVGPRQPTEEEIRSAAKSSGIPVLTPSEGEKLRKLILDAAIASGENRINEAIRLQQQACDLCRSAGLRLEESLMTMVLASYYQQANQTAQAVVSYKRASEIAEEIKAYPQVAQAQMSLGYLYMTQKLYDIAALSYEKASESAVKAEDAILGIEALRMAGTCYLKLKDRDSAERCWRKALKLGESAEPAQIRLSSFMDVATALIDLLNRKKLKDQARSIELLIMEIGEKVG